MDLGKEGGEAIWSEPTASAWETEEEGDIIGSRILPREEEVQETY